MCDIHIYYVYIWNDDMFYMTLKYLPIVFNYPELLWLFFSYTCFRFILVGVDNRKLEPVS